VYTAQIDNDLVSATIQTAAAAAFERFCRAAGHKRFHRRPDQAVADRPSRH
jgi:hypothetical protein